jgi:transposase
MTSVSRHLTDAWSGGHLDAPGATARAAADLAGVNRHTATLYFLKLRELIAAKLAEQEPRLSGEIEVDESYFRGARKGKRGRGTAGKLPVFGLLKRRGKVHALIIPNTQQTTLLSINRQTIKPDSIVCTNGFSSYGALDVSEFRHERINHSEAFVKQRNQINGIENFWNQAKRHLRRYNGIPRHHFHLFLKECEWRFNYRPTRNLFKVLMVWAKQALL